MRAIADLDPASGHVFADGLERREMTGPEWRRIVRYVAAGAAVVDGAGARCVRAIRLRPRASPDRQPRSFSGPARPSGHAALDRRAAEARARAGALRTSRRCCFSTNRRVRSTRRVLRSSRNSSAFRCSRGARFWWQAMTWGSCGASPRANCSLARRHLTGWRACAGSLARDIFGTAAMTSYIPLSYIDLALAARPAHRKRGDLARVPARPRKEPPRRKRAPRRSARARGAGPQLHLRDHIAVADAGFALIMGAGAAYEVHHRQETRIAGPLAMGLGAVTPFVAGSSQRCSLRSPSSIPTRGMRHGMCCRCSA